MNGLINVYKEKGLTSHDVIYQLRKILSIKRIGHSGTLDPEAEGVLVVGVSQGTKLMEYIGDNFKVYEGELVLGYSSTTEDIHGELKKAPYTAKIDKEKIDNILGDLSGKVIAQKPPMYSSVKVNGRKLYQYARAGIEVERSSRNIEILKIEAISDIYEKYGAKVIRFKAEVSKGTYIRTLCVHIGELLGASGIMGDLLRTQVGSFKIKDSLKLQEIAIMAANKDYSFLLPLIKGIEHVLNQIELKAEDYEKIKLGQKIANTYDISEDQVFAATYQGSLTAILIVKEGILRIVKNIVE